ncbi:hypothetical protein [Cerasicoccus fimbriatus]|uniref:hypothetical protein n=1 Tax=Cerasicoccus fimbriatus TaxID=3014554 RepID=UPI0022B2B217|nr:hypothetical protein [Cerasicoccus sp. TK19100]
MKAESGINPCKKITWQERYACWMLKPKFGEKWFEKYLGRNWVWWFAGFTGILMFGALAYMGIKLLPFENRHVPPEVNVEELTESELELIGPYVWAYEFEKLRSTMHANLLRGILLGGGIGALIFYPISALVHEERKGYRQIISRLESELEEARQIAEGGD